MNKSVDPKKVEASDSQLEQVLEIHSHIFNEDIESVADLKQRSEEDYDRLKFQYALDVAKLLVVPDKKDPIDHTRDLSEAAREMYESNATRIADKQHQAARTLAEHHGFDWKKDVVSEKE